jgi:hypothetical protein
MTDDDKTALTAEVKRCNERLNLIDQDDHLRSGADSIRTVEILLSLRDQVGAIRDQIGLLIEMLPDTWEEGALYDATHLLQKRADFIKARLNQEAVDYLDARTVDSLELNAGDLEKSPDEIDFEFGELSAEALRKLEELPPTGPVTDDEINEVTRLMEAQAVAAEQFGSISSMRSVSNSSLSATRLTKTGSRARKRTFANPPLSSFDRRKKG